MFPIPMFPIAPKEAVMIPPNRARLLPVVTLAALLAVPAQACDPEDLIREYRSMCAVAPSALRELVTSLGDGIRPETRAAVLARADEALKLCRDDRYDDGMKHALHAARLLGNGETRDGLPGERVSAAAVNP